MRICSVSASKLVRAGINLSDYTGRHHSVEWRCFPPFDALSGNVFETGEAGLVGGNVSGLTKDLVVVTF